MKANTSSTARRADPVTTRQVVDWIRERIRIGRFVPGQRLVEADIIRATEASRGKVREALQRLETEGLVTIEEFRGASVKQLSLSEVQQIYRAREVLEGLAAAEFAAADAPAAKQRLLQIQDELNQWESGGDHDRFARLNTAWHALIIEGSGNDYVRQFLARLAVPIYRLLFASLYSANRIRNANADHRRITAAIVAGDAREAERAMRDHVSQGLLALSELNSQFYR